MTQYIQNDKYCNYLDYNLHPANKMLQKCVGDEDPQQACRYQMKTQMFNNSINGYIFSDRIMIDGTEGYHTNPDFYTQNIISEKVDELNGVEGFVSGSGAGEIQVEDNKCPESYLKCPVTGLCKQVCRNCRLPNGKSYYMNEKDPCFPNGVFNGYDNNGELMCTCGKKNEYCNDKKNIYTVGGILLV
tara:strand:+ start:523 stop:1083 length:561 start_codon:yes stop_codon:yes gene_type:complete